MAKADLIEELKALGGDTAGLTVPQLEARIAEIREGRERAVDAEGVEDVTDLARQQPDAVVPEVREDDDVYLAMSVLDERLIMAEIQGRALDVMVYSFQQDGKPVTGLSWKGVGEAVRTYNARSAGAIEVVSEPQPRWTEVLVPVEIRPDGNEEERIKPMPAIMCEVYARNASLGGGNWGMAVQPLAYRVNPKHRKNPDGSYIFKADPFGRTKALSKAQRNAQEPLLPIELVEEVKVQYLGQGQVERIRGASSVVPELEAGPKALDDDLARELTHKARNTYDELRGLNPQLMPPGRFHNGLTRAHHSHDELRSFGDTLVDLVALEKRIATTLERFPDEAAAQIAYRDAQQGGPPRREIADRLDHLLAELQGVEDA